MKVPARVFARLRLSQFRALHAAYAASERIRSRYL
jgi:hypothetical protein